MSQEASGSASTLDGVIIVKRICYGAASVLAAFLIGLAGFGGMDAVLEQGWIVFLALAIAAVGVIIEIHQHLENVEAVAVVESAADGGTSAVRQSRVEPAGPTARLYIPGVTMHGRMRAGLNIRTHEHMVSWAANRRDVGTLRPGAKDGWDVYDVNDELLGWAPDVRAGMELLEETAE